MFLEFGSMEDRQRTAAPSPSPSPWHAPGRAWTAIVPFFNERDHLATTLASLAAQYEPPAIVLVDNASTDGSAAVGMAACHRLGLPVTLIEERRPGKVAALAAGLAHVHTPFVATCDADTWYPVDYLARAQALLERDGCVAAGAFFVDRKAGALARLAAAIGILAAARLLPAQCHAGGAGQAFNTQALRLAGGFDPARWEYVLEDHEIIHRIMRWGAMHYGASLWCAPLRRPRDRRSVRWTLIERLVYIATIGTRGDWFFYNFLARRLAARGLSSQSLRETPFQSLQLPSIPFQPSQLQPIQGGARVTTDPVCG